VVADAPRCAHGDGYDDKDRDFRHAFLRAGAKVKNLLLGPLVPFWPSWAGLHVEFALLRQRPSLIRIKGDMERDFRCS
jgi:hypothetical protein